MKIKLESPYSEDWINGYLVINSENRRNIVLYNSPMSRTTVSYARYLMSVNLGRYLTELEHVDHIDEDKTNDVLENLQILTPAQNTAKNNIARSKFTKFLVLRCPVCHNIFTRKRGNTQAVMSKQHLVSSCSRKCAREFQNLKIDVELRELLSSEQLKLAEF